MSRKSQLVFRVGAIFSAVVAAVVMSVVSLAPSVSATSDEELLKKTLLNLLPICYSQHMANSVENASAFFPQNVADSTQAYLVPTNVGNSLNNQKISCQEVFDGVSGWGGLATKMNGLLDLYGKGGGPFNPEDFGYKPSAGATTTNRKCVYLTYTYNDPNSDYDYPDQKTNSVCFPVASDGKVSIENPFNDIKCISPEGNEETMSECGSTITESGRIKLYYDSSMESLQTYMNDARAGTYTTWVASLYNKTYSQVWSELQSNAPDVTGGVNFEEQSVSNVSAHEDNSGSGGSTSTSYAKESLADQTALKYFTGSDSYTNVYFTDNDWASLYMAYFQQVKDKHGLRLDASSCSSSKDGVANAITTDGGQTWCSISNISDVPDSEKFAGRARRGDNRLSERTFAQIVADFGTLDFSKVDNSTLGNLGLNTGGDSSSGSTSENAATPNCFNSAGSLGWILCPVLEGLSTVVDGIYDNIIVPQFLEIDASFMAADSSGSVYKGWTDFRNYANILFAILFIVVIFAQVTGIGISNYNVKKILPRLIMTVVLVNISFILCQLAVDLSNILGFSLKKLFVDMAGETVVTVGGFVGKVSSCFDYHNWRCYRRSCDCCCYHLGILALSVAALPARHYHQHFLLCHYIGREKSGHFNSHRFSTSRNRVLYAPEYKEILRPLAQNVLIFDLSLPNLWPTDGRRTVRIDNFAGCRKWRRCRVLHGFSRNAHTGCSVLLHSFARQRIAGRNGQLGHENF